MDWSFRHNWDEYTWGREIRKDELRIAGYFRALPGCLDLPGEEQMIFDRLMTQPELIPTGVSDPQRMLKAELERLEEEGDWDEDRKENRIRFEATHPVEKLAVEWNTLAVSQLKMDLWQDALAVTCAFGKLISRLYNFEETEQTDETVALRIGLLKRMLADENELLYLFDQLKEKESETFAVRIDEFCNALGFVREVILDRIKELRTGGSKQ